MNDMALFAALGVFIVASPAFFFLGRSLGSSAGKRSELERQGASKSTAEETARRIIFEAEREVETSRDRKSVV